MKPTIRPTKVCHNTFLEEDGYCAKCGQHHYEIAFGKVIRHTTYEDQDAVRPEPVISSNSPVPQPEQVFEDDVKNYDLEGVYDEELGRATRVKITTRYFVPGKEKPSEVKVRKSGQAENPSATDYWILQR